MTKKSRERRVEILINKHDKHMEQEEAKDKPDFEKLDQLAREKNQLLKKKYGRA